MADCEIAKHALKVVVAQICQNIGWHAVQSSPMDILVDVLQRYVVEISKSVHQYSTQYNRTEPNLDDLGLTFKDFGINLQEIEEYINNVEPVPPPYKIASFPVKHPSNLQHPKPDSRELLVRPEHIPSYLPLMHPDLEEDVVFSQNSSVDGGKKNSLEAGASGDSPSPLSSPKHGSKRNDWPGETNKRSRYYTEEEGRPMREVTSVFMTPSGFISPVHEGKTAEASLPCLVDSPPPTPEQPSHTFTPVSSKKDSKFKDIKKDKSKSKKDKEASKKDVKKVKSSKKEKENKENAVGKHEKSVTSSSSSKKEHCSSHKSTKLEKSMKSDDSVRPKSKSDRMKLKAQKDEFRKVKESFKLSKMKAKLKHSGGSSSSSHIKSSKLSSSKKLKAARVAKSIKHFKGERMKSAEPEPVPPPEPVLPKVIPVEPKPPPVEVKVEKEIIDEPMEVDELDFREESPESRLVIDDSLETQARQERESRLEVIDECIEAVIRRGEEESEVENKAMDETINSVVRGPPVMKKLEPKDIYDFTDTSDSSSLSSCDMTPHSPIQTSIKKEKKTSDSNKRSSESPKRSKKDKNKKKGSKDSRPKSPTPYSSPKSQKSSSFMLKVEDRTPSPILKDDLLSSDGSTPSSSPRSNSFFDHSPQPSSHVHAPPLLSHVPPLPPPLVPGSSYTSSPFAPMRTLPCHTNPHFPTPPLFVTPSKTESGNSFQNMPLNLAKSGPSSQKSSPEKLETNTSHSSVKTDNSDLIKKAANIIDKAKAKDHKKDKFKKKGKKESEKVKKKEEKEEIREKEKPKPKEKPKTKSEKNVKAEKRKSKPEKKKAKEKEEKVKEDSTVPKMTLKLTSGSGSTKICVKPNTKNSTSLSSSPSPSHGSEEERTRTPSPPVRIPTPSPPRVPTPPPPPRIPTPPPPSPSPPPVVKEIKEEVPVPVPPPPITKTQHSRGRGRGKKAAVPAPRTVITETVGTIVDESGNKIWICPACSRADDGSPMIGCDECDDWYHWVCVGIVVPPKEEENWFCVRCIAKRQGPTIKRRRKKHKKDK
ncbi:transcription initiation factor TFIID subunit 3 [Nephila pilipes]|uniref:Transcription initiation factor TFIID subunit 3 n=1 Tax=Nephila pilipes TaxID=299642 RepID=A0A8X6QIZ6_NEPPI|nr:transcription initiation factor TFIID subunit 3 [Nephila pilipes]